LLKDLILILNLLKTLIIKPALLISLIVAILTFILTFILTSALILIILIISALALAELTLLSTPKIAAALLLATYISTDS
jgi:hypothetical protein